MNHPGEEQLLLNAYGELPSDEAAEIERHLATCAECRGRFIALEEGRAVLDWGFEHRPPRSRRAWWIALPLAAGIGALLLARHPAPSARAWQPHLVGSATAGYVTGGADLIAIDSQLTQLERRRTYGTPGN